MNITKGVIARAQKVVIYGPEGIGKSTFASQFPDPLFCDTEGSTSNMDVSRLDRPTSWTLLLQQVDWVKQKRPCQTYVIDTADWAERLCIEYLCQKYQKKGIEDFGYGNGYTYLGEEFGKLLNKLSELIEVGINVVLTAHSQIRKFEQPDELGAYDRYELKLGNKKTLATTSSLVKEWADMVLFCNYQTTVVTGDKDKKKAVGGKRVMHTTHHPAWDAKNRFGLPEDLDMNFENISHIFKPTQNQPQPEPMPFDEPVQQPVTDPQPEPNVPNFGPERNETIPPVIPQALADLMRMDQVSTDEIMQIIYQGGFMPQDTPLENVPTGLWEHLATNWSAAMGLLNNQIRNF